MVQCLLPTAGEVGRQDVQNGGHPSLLPETQPISWALIPSWTHPDFAGESQES